MGEATTSGPRGDLRRLICSTIDENEAFLYDHARDPYDQLVRLVNDAIDAMTSASREPGRQADYVENATAFFTYHALLPLANALLVDLLVGNLPGCFMLLRLLLETLVKCWTADRYYPQLGFFADRLQRLDDAKVSTSKMLRTMGNALKDSGAGLALWRNLSGHWAHMPGYSRKIVTAVATTGEIPAWALAVPISYASGDLDAIFEIGSSVAEFREFLGRAIGAAGRPNANGE